ncbi:MAG: hypothetical protein ACK5K7_05590 [Bacilli bacterium]
MLKLTNLLLITAIILTGCSIINVHKFSKMYIDAFTLKENTQYAKYTAITVDTYNSQLNQKLYTTLLSRATIYTIDFNEDEIDELNQVVNQFREKVVRIVLIDANEKNNTATVKVYISDSYELLITELKENVTSDIASEEYRLEIINSLKTTFKNTKNDDSVETKINIKKDEITGKYYISKQSEEKLIEFILGLK